jgi:hypothetical protein
MENRISFWPVISQNRSFSKEFPLIPSVFFVVLNGCKTVTFCRKSHSMETVNIGRNM